MDAEGELSPHLKAYRRSECLALHCRCLAGDRSDLSRSGRKGPAGEGG